MGISLAKIMKEGDVLALDGDLGSGKTVLVKGIAKGLHINQEILSPTFTLLRQYTSPVEFNHFDIYRIEDEEELFEIGFDEYLGSGITVVEWALRAKELMPDSAVFINITRGEEAEERVFSLSSADKEKERIYYEALKNADIGD